ncbi:MAG: ABC transporter ATP-binding protein [bacterium]|nr:ABC transporter ATP-binding protein [bacterium]
MIKTLNLSKRFGGFLLDDINLNIDKGEYFVILGPSGAGKTCFLETIAGIYEPDKGEIWLNGKEISKLPPETRNIGLVFQDSALFPHLKVIDNVKYGLKIKKFKPKEIKEKVDNVLELLHISQIKNAYPKSISGGEKKRVALARTLVLEPKILLLDEPLSAIHPNLKRKLQEEIRSIHQELNITTIHVTHDFNTAVSLADKIGIMNQGRIVQIGVPEKVFQQPNSEFVAQFVGCENLFKGNLIEDNGVKKFKNERLSFQVTTSHKGQAYVSIRPEDIIISKNPLVSTSARNCLLGKIAKIIEKGPIVKVVVDAGEDFMVLITKESLKDLELKIGEIIYLVFKVVAVHVF